MRLIDADKLKHKIMYANPDIDEDWYGLYDSVIEEIDNAPTIEPKTNAWIPVSERLPEKSGRYLCTHGGTYLRGIDFYETQNDALKDEFGDFGWRSQNVIAWMPLPEPYKAENVIKES